MITCAGPKLESRVGQCLELLDFVVRTDHLWSPASSANRIDRASPKTQWIPPAASTPIALTRPPLSLVRHVNQHRTAKAAAQDLTISRSTSNCLARSFCQHSHSPISHAKYCQTSWNANILPATVPPRAPLSFAGSTGKYCITNVSAIMRSPASPHHNGLSGHPSEAGRTWTGL